MGPRVHMAEAQRWVELADGGARRRELGWARLGHLQVQGEEASWPVGIALTIGGQS